MVKSIANEKNQTLSLYSIFFSILGGHFEAPVSLMDAPLTLFRLDLVTWCSHKGWFHPWLVGIGLRLDLVLDEGYFLKDNQCTLAFPKYLLHGLNDMHGRQLAGTNMSKLVTSGACHLEILWNRIEKYTIYVHTYLKNTQYVPFK